MHLRNIEHGKRQSEAVNWRRIDNTIVKRKEQIETMINKTLHKLKIKQHVPRQKEVNSGNPAPLMAAVVLLL
jgi:hypothetical protein